jgi:hypothetical protein
MNPFTVASVSSSSIRFFRHWGFAPTYANFNGKMSSGGFLYNKILAKSLQNLNLDTLQKFNVLAGLSNTRTYGKRLKYSQDKTLPRAIQRRQDCRINI